MQSRDPKNELRIFLASSSPRRKDLLYKIFNHFEVVNIGSLKENFNFSNPEKLVLFNSTKKAELALKIVDHFKSIIIAADTVIEIDNRILGKPKNKEEAKNFLLQLSGRAHNVFTGVNICINDIELINSNPDIYKINDESLNKNNLYIQYIVEVKSDLHYAFIKFVDVTKVSFNELTYSSIDKYVERYLPLDKAGGYGIQEIEGGYIKEIEGDYDNVVGLPVIKLRKIFKELKIIY